METSQPQTSDLTALPRVAVIIPTYNRWPHVCAAVDSVLAQTYPNIECIVVDDASTDGTSDFLRGKYGDRIRLLTKARNGEKSAARNDGIGAAQAAFVCMLDSDDVLTATSVEGRARLFLEDRSFDGVAYGPDQAEWVRQGWRRARRYWPEGDVLRSYIRHPFVNNNGYLISLANMKRYGMYREDLTHHEDVELLIRLAARFEFRCSGNPVARTRRIDRSSRYDDSKYLRQGDRLLFHLRNDVFVTKRLGTDLERVEWSEARAQARACYRTGDFPSFRRSYWRLWRQWPGRMLREGRFLRRYLASFVLQPVGRSPQTPDDRPLVTRSFIIDLLEGRVPAEVRKKDGRWIARTTLVDTGGLQRSVYLKVYSGKRSWAVVRRLKSRLNGDGTPAAVERQNIEWAGRQGISVPRLVAAIDFRDPALTFTSVLITEELSETQPLHVQIPNAAKELSPARFRRWKGDLAQEIARVAGLLHRADRYHKDLYLCHFFLPETAATDGLPLVGRLHLLDFLRLKHHRLRRRRWQVKDLAQLLYSSDVPGIGVRDRLSFMHAYLGCSRLDRNGRRLVRSVVRKAERYRRQNRKEGLSGPRARVGWF